MKNKMIEERTGDDYEKFEVKNKDDTFFCINESHSFTTY